ncbi:MAG: polymer-forming cytoskeletal protein [Treponema sp.]|jgi:cytoskeletal protein CcmA (bactofilin family)|nr:polymer-forming cytoskeletal protein [Treponema sp.]
MTDVHTDTLEDEDFDTILPPDVDFSGDLNFEKPFLIQGKISGKINARGILVIDKDAVVDADISAPRVVIRGTVTGNVSASEKVELSGTGRLQGNVDTPKIMMETGCIFNGLCSMDEKAP